MKPMFGVSLEAEAAPKKSVKKAAKKIALRQPEAEQVPAETPAAPKKRAAKKSTKTTEAAKPLSLAKLKLIASRAVKAAEAAERREDLSTAKSDVTFYTKEEKRLTRELEQTVKAKLKAETKLEKLVGPGA